MADKLLTKVPKLPKRPSANQGKIKKNEAQMESIFGHNGFINFTRSGNISSPEFLVHSPMSFVIKGKQFD